jgi:DNA polymerase-3 subunit alpha
MMNPVTHLHFHTEYSLQDSLLRIDQLPAIIDEYNIKALAVTDHGTVDAAVKFYEAVSKTKAKPILGCEFYVVDDLRDRESKHRYHMVALAKSRAGFTSIMRALTVANLDGFYYRPRIDWGYIFENLNDVVVMTACRDGLLSHPNWKELLEVFQLKYKEDFYIEAILLKNHKPQYAVNAMARDVSQKFGIKLALTGDVHYKMPADWKARNVVRAIANNFRISPGIQPEPDEADIYVKNYDQMMESARAFGFDDEAAITEVWDEIADKCSFVLEPATVAIPVAYEEAKADPGAYLRNLCGRLYQKFPSLVSNPKAAERLDYELNQIVEGGFAEYFLLVQEMILWAKSNGCKVGPGRGSVGGSLVAYVLGITDVNPLDYDLVFERFISPGRHDLPDIDIDFEDDERERVIQHMREKYGANKVAYVSTFATTKGRGSVRDIGRAFDVPLVEIDQIAKQILVRSGGDARSDFTVEDTVELFENAREFNRKYPYVIESAKVIEGLTKTKGVHAAGLVVDTGDLYSGEKCVLQRGKNNQIVVNWDKKDIEYMGMMKIDALGLKTLNILRRIIDLIKRRHNKDIDLLSIPFDDEKVFEAFRRADTVGVFQFGSTGMMQYLREFKPVNFTELYQVNALWRPGTLRSGLATEFIQYKNDEKKPNYINNKLKEILKETYGIVLFQEQVMYILNRLGNIPWRTTDVIRKVVSKSEGQEKFETFRQQFLDGVKELKSMTKPEADKIFDLMKFFGSYGFNKSHSVEYTFLGYWMMWLKVYYPIEYLCASLQRASDRADITELLNDAALKGVRVRLPDINKSEASWTVDDEGALRAGLNIIKGVSDRIAEDIVRARNESGGAFDSFEQFRSSVTKRIVNVAKVRVLLEANAVASLMDDITRNKCLLYIEKYKSAPTDLTLLSEIPEDVMPIVNDDIFNFDVSEDFYGTGSKLIELLTPHLGMKKLTAVSDLLIEGTMPHYWYAGKFDEIKYGYRAKVQNTAGDSKGFANDLGGVYGVFRDDTYHAYATVTGDLYHNPEKKGMIEESAGKLMVMWADKPFKTGSLFAHRLYPLEDLKHGTFEDMPVAGLIGVDPPDLTTVVNSIKDCSLCAGRADCRAPVPFTQGVLSRVMIVGEAPGADEDREGVPFLGRAGRVLWELLPMERGLIHITNVIKCRPKDNKITDQSIVTTCSSQWLKREIDMVRPVLILVLGKTALRFFTGDKTASIMERNASVEWNDKIGSWIVYGIHPAMVLYSAESKPMLAAATNKFADLFAQLMPE